MKKSFSTRSLSDRLEVFNSTQAQYPQVAEKLEVLSQLALSGRIKQVTSEELYYLLRKMGLRVKLNTKMRIQEHGKLKSIKDKMKEYGAICTD